MKPSEMFPYVADKYQRMNYITRLRKENKNRLRIKLLVACVIALLLLLSFTLLLVLAGFNPIPALMTVILVIIIGIAFLDRR